MVKNTRVTAFTVSEFLKENQQWGEGGGGGWNYLPPRLGLMKQTDILSAFGFLEFMMALSTPSNTRSCYVILSHFSVHSNSDWGLKLRWTAYFCFEMVSSMLPF